MSILPQHHRAANPAAHDAFRDICHDPGCEAPAMPDLPTPLCATCARAVAYAYLAATEHERERRPAPEPPSADLPPLDKYAQPGFVYFVRFGERVKIGFTSNLRQRMKVIPHDEVLATFPGTYRDEQRCHAAFAHLRITGEWFEDAPDLRAFIAGTATAAA